LSEGNLYRKSEDKLVKISKSEARWLKDNGFSKYINSSNVCHKSKNKTYYIVEDIKALTALKKYRDSKTKESYK